MSNICNMYETCAVYSSFCEEKTNIFFLIQQTNYTW